MGDLKLVAKDPRPWELCDQASGRPDEVARLAGVYDAWAARGGGLPWDNARTRSPKFAATVAEKEPVR